MFVEGKGRIDTLVKIFCYYPEKSVRYQVITEKKKVKVYLVHKKIKREENL